MARLIWTDAALADLDAIADHIALQNLEAAKGLVRDVFKGGDQLKRFPNSGRYPPELEEGPYRELLVSPCRIFYRVEKRSVIILHVMRSERLLRAFMISARDPEST